MEISHSRMHKPHLEWRVPIHARRIPVLNGDFMSIQNGDEWTLEWDLPVSEWEKMARRPVTSSIQREDDLKNFSCQLHGDKWNCNGIKWKLRKYRRCLQNFAQRLQRFHHRCHITLQKRRFVQLQILDSLLV
jgi:hypothetical protein